MPVPRMSMCEYADYPFRGKSSYDERIFIDVNVIIKIDEIVTQRLAEHGRVAATRTRQTRKSVTHDFERRPRTHDPDPETPDERSRRFEACRSFVARVLGRRAAICYAWIT